ncbi:MAG: zinc-dependent metalloprotease, partial [Saprospiraceae bacterium]
EKHLVAGSAYEDFNNIETELLQVIEQKVGQKRTVKNLTDEEQKLQDWINQQPITKNGNGGGSIVEYTIANPSLTGAFNEFLEFDINIASLLSSEEFFSGEILIDYNTLTFGSNLVASGIVNITKGNVILTPNYTITITDVSASKLKIEVLSSSNNPNTLYLIDNTAEQLVHLKIDITNLVGNTGIEFDEINMQGASEFFDISSNVVEPFELVKADDELNVDVNALIVPAITDFYPKIVRGGVDTITIVGTGFGNYRDLGYVEFTNAREGPLFIEWIRPYSTEYISWSNTMIKVKVTSYGSNDGISFSDNYYAGTGKIKVISDVGVTSPQSDSTLNVTFSISTKNTNLGNGTFTPIELTLIKRNIKGGYTLSLDTSFTNNLTIPGAKDAFERALITWRCETGVNFIINDTIPNTPIGNEIFIKLDTTLPIDVPARTKLWLIPNCTGSTQPYLSKFMITFSTKNLWYTDINEVPPLPLNTFDFETIALHELGHAHLLNHSNSQINTMWWETRPITSPFFRNLDITAKMGGDYIMDISAVNPPSNACLPPMDMIDISYCSIINVTNKKIKQLDISVYPNPTNSSIMVETSNIIGNYTMQIFNSQGQLLLQKRGNNLFEEFNLSQLSQGIYFLKIYDENGISTSKKIIKY